MAKDFNHIIEFRPLDVSGGKAARYRYIAKE